MRSRFRISLCVVATVAAGIVVLPATGASAAAEYTFTAKQCNSYTETTLVFKVCDKPVNSTVETLIKVTSGEANGNFELLKGTEPGAHDYLDGPIESVYGGYYAQIAFNALPNGTYHVSWLGNGGKYWAAPQLVVSA